METDTLKTAEPYVLGEGEGEAIWYVNIHHAEDEAFWILEGYLTVKAGNRTYTAGPGSFVFGPKGIPHTFRVEGGTHARLLVLMVPGGGEAFFIEAGRPAEGEGLPQPQPPDLVRLQAMMEKYHQEVVGPPLPPA